MTTSLDTARDNNKLKIGVGLFDLSEHYYKLRSGQMSFLFKQRDERHENMVNIAK